ncbi:unnamed protein product [Urochloa humidicola]
MREVRARPERSLRGRGARHAGRLAAAAAVARAWPGWGSSTASSIRPVGRRREREQSAKSTRTSSGVSTVSDGDGSPAAGRQELIHPQVLVPHSMKSLAPEQRGRGSRRPRGRGGCTAAVSLLGGSRELPERRRRQALKAGGARGSISLLQLLQLFFCFKKESGKTSSIILLL